MKYVFIFIIENKKKLMIKIKEKEVKYIIFLVIDYILYYIVLYR